ncbi:hypothetical protein DKX38_007884 [Salix brachista]|uniref:Pentatricopeptide repeat-containing protein n=1 Tax=Salix brachista TaxID=2182728 RepID=A0A5N5MP80_9ROSI|nr:hypothetical protein DKX38_007884 [Salix brachista]
MKLDMNACNVALEGCCCELESVSEAEKVIETMSVLGIKPNELSFGFLAYLYALKGFKDKIIELTGLISGFGFSNKRLFCSYLISGHVKSGNLEAVSETILCSLREQALDSVLSAIASLAALDFGLLVHAESLKLGLHSNVYVGSSLVSMYAKCGKMEAAKKVFNTVDEQNVVLWNAMLGGYVQNGHAYEVIELFFNMKSCGFYPDDFTYSSILSACACLKYLDLGRQLHSFIIKDKFASNLFVGNALVDMYAKSGALEDARQQFELIRNRDNVSWN